MLTSTAAKIINGYFYSASAGTRTRMLAAADSHALRLTEYRTIIRGDWAGRCPVDSRLPPPALLTVEDAADVINLHFEELPAYTRERILRAFNITRPAFDLDYTRIIVESEFRCIRSGVTTGHVTRQDITNEVRV